MNKVIRYSGGVLVCTITGLIVGWLFGALGDYTFRRFVNSFYPPGSRYSGLMHAISGFATVFRPVAGFGPVAGAVYYCWRHQLKMRYVFWTGLVGFTLAFLFDSYVTADPGPNFHTSEYTALWYCFAGALFGTYLQAGYGDWSHRKSSVQLKPLARQSAPDYNVRKSKSSL